MTIYHKPVRLLFRDMVEDIGLEKGDTITKDQGVEWFRHKYPKIKTGTITAHFIRLSTNAKTRVHYNATPEDDLLYQIDGSHFRLYEPGIDPPPIYEHAINEPYEEIDEPKEIAHTAEFAYEQDLQNFLAKNLKIIEPGLKLYDDEGITGIEFPVGGRSIDILAVDQQNNYVVIELKVSRGYDRVIGQLLRYMAWIVKHQADEEQKVRGIIIAREISEDLLLACSQIPGVELFDYSLSVSLSRVAS